MLHNWNAHRYLSSLSEYACWNATIVLRQSRFSSLFLMLNANFTWSESHKYSACPPKETPGNQIRPSSVCLIQAVICLSSRLDYFFIKAVEYFFARNSNIFIWMLDRTNL